MNRADYYTARSAIRAWRRNCRRFSLTERQAQDDATRLRPLPQPRRTPMADLILRQADRRRSVLYAVGLRRRQAERDALPPVPSRVPPVPGWGRSEGARA